MVSPGGAGLYTLPGDPQAGAVGAVRALALGRAAAVAEARGAESGWALLEAVPIESAKSYQPYWAPAASLPRRMGRPAEAANACSCAIGLCQDQAVREFLMRQISEAEVRTGGRSG